MSNPDAPAPRSSYDDPAVRDAVRAHTAPVDDAEGEAFTHDDPAVEAAVRAYMAVRDMPPTSRPFTVKNSDRYRVNITPLDDNYGRMDLVSVASGEVVGTRPRVYYSDFYRTTQELIARADADGPDDCPLAVAAQIALLSKRLHGLVSAGKSAPHLPSYFAHLTTTCEDLVGAAHIPAFTIAERAEATSVADDLAEAAVHAHAAGMQLGAAMSSMSQARNAATRASANTLPAERG